MNHRPFFLADGVLCDLSRPDHSRNRSSEIAKKAFGYPQKHNVDGDRPLDIKNTVVCCMLWSPSQWSEVFQTAPGVKGTPARINFRSQRKANHLLDCLFHHPGFESFNCCHQHWWGKVISEVCKCLMYQIFQKLKSKAFIIRKSEIISKSQKTHFVLFRQSSKQNNPSIGMLFVHCKFRQWTMNNEQKVQVGKQSNTKVGKKMKKAFLSLSRPRLKPCGMKPYSKKRRTKARCFRLVKLFLRKWVCFVFLYLLFFYYLNHVSRCFGKQIQAWTPPKRMACEVW